VGREAERDLIADAVDRGAAGSGTPLIVSGDVGMGKTSLGREGLEIARGTGSRGWRDAVSRSIGSWLTHPSSRHSVGSCGACDPPRRTHLGTATAEPPY
jgi:AAA ATPase domain